MFKALNFRKYICFNFQKVRSNFIFGNVKNLIIFLEKSIHLELDIEVSIGSVLESRLE